MKTKKAKKASSVAARASAAPTDTSRWEQLLKAPRGGVVAVAGGASSAPSSASAAAGVVSKPGKTARRADKLPTKDKTLGNFCSSVMSNWDMLLQNGRGNTAPAAAAGGAGANGHLSVKAKAKKKKNRGSEGGKRPRSEAGQARGSNGTTATSPDFFALKRAPNTAAQSKSAAGAPGSGAGIGGKAGKKRKRTSAASSDANGKAAPAAAAAFPGAASRQHQPSGAANKSKRPRSNVLNLAFQAQKEEEQQQQQQQATGGAGGSKSRHKGGNKGRGSGAGTRGGSEQALTDAEKSQYVALDCEMVGVGPGGCRSALARCCLVDWDGNTIYDKHVTPNERVTDFRTFVSGVKANHLKGGLRLRQCQEEVAAVLKDKVLVGHALHNDLKALMMSHPPRATRDTATYRPYQKAHGKAGGKLRPKSLKILSQEHLDRAIQSGQHNPAEDARAAMDLYKLARFEWEKSLSTAGKMRGRRAVVDQQGP